MHNILYAPTIRVPLYSLHKHLTGCGCVFLGDDSLGGLFVYFPSFSSLSTLPETATSVINPSDEKQLSATFTMFSQSVPSKFLLQPRSRQNPHKSHTGRIGDLSSMHFTLPNKVTDLSILLHMMNSLQMEFLPSLLHFPALFKFLIQTFPRSNSSPLCLVKTSTSTCISLIQPSHRV